MQNYITSLSASKSSQIVNDRLSWDEGSPHRHDCHDPPHEARGGFVDDRSPPRRLAAGARSDLESYKGSSWIPGGRNSEAKIILGCRARPLEHAEGAEIAC